MVAITQGISGTGRGSHYWDMTPRPKKIPQASPVSKTFSHMVKPLTAFRELPKDAARWNAKTNASSIATKLASAASSLVRVASMIASAFSPSNSVPGEPVNPKISKVTKTVTASLSYVKIAYVGIVAYTVYDLVNNLRTLKKDTVDSALRIGKNLSDIGYAVSTMLSGLQGINVIASTALKIIPGINIAAAVLSGAEFFTHVKATYMHKKNLARLKSCPNNFGAMKTLLREIRITKDEGYFEKHYGVSGHVMRKRLREINRQVNEDIETGNRLNARRTVDLTVHNLRNRTKMNVIESQMGMIAALVATIALIIIAISPLGPLAVLGFTMFALAAALQAVSMIHERVTHHKFLESMGIEE